MHIGIDDIVEKTKECDILLFKFSELNNSIPNAPQKINVTPTYFVRVAKETDIDSNTNSLRLFCDIYLENKNKLRITNNINKGSDKAIIELLNNIYELKIANIPKKAKMLEDKNCLKKKTPPT